MINVLFVCLGNICRSPLAQAVFAKQVAQRGLTDKISADSCGTGAYHIGSKPDDRSIIIAQRHDVPIHHFARQLIPADFAAFHYIVGMDEKNMQNIQSMSGNSTAKILKMRYFDSMGKNKDVPDPYYGDIEGFEEVYQIVDRSCEQLLSFIIAEEQLDVGK